MTNLYSQPETIRRLSIPANEMFFLLKGVTDGYFTIDLIICEFFVELSFNETQCSLFFFQVIFT